MMMQVLRETLRRVLSERALRRRLRRKLAALDIPGPTDMADVCARLGQQRGKPIQLSAMPLDAQGPFGAWISTPTCDYIVYQQRTTRAHQEHIIAHEVGHVLSDHPSGADSAEVWAQLMPDLPVSLIQRALGREHYDTDAEREAEAVATLLLESAAVDQYLQVPAHSDRAGRAQAALDDSRRWV